MNNLTRGAIVFVALGVLVLLAIINTVQLNNVERRVRDNSAALQSLMRDGVRSTEGNGTPAACDISPPYTYSEEEEAALDDPANLLARPTKPLAVGDPVRCGGTLNFKEGSDPRGLNVYIANGADVTKFARINNNRLATRVLGDEDTYVPELAIKVTSPDDGLTYRIQLRKGVYWHRPTVDWSTGRYDWLEGDHELTSDDYKFVFDMLANAQVTGRISALRNYFESLESFTVIDDHTFEIKYTERLFTNLGQILDLEPAPRWLMMYDEDGREFDAATWGLKVNEHWYNRKAIGTGPYRFVEWEPGVRLIYERNERYWGEPPTFDRLYVQIIKDQVAWPRKLKTGELDISQLQPEQYRTEVLEGGEPYLGQEKLSLARQPTMTYFYMGWNTGTVFFSDKRVRQAMTHSLDRQGLIDNVFHGLGTLHTGPVAKQSPCYDKTVEPWAYDLALARKKLDAAGWKDLDGNGIREKIIDGETVEFEFSFLIYGSSTEYETLANIWREDLLSVGVKMVPVALEWSTMLKRMDERDFDGYTGAWVTSWDTDFYQLWHSSEADKPNSSNRIGFRNPEADRIATELRREFDPTRRADLCHAFHRMVHEEQPYTFFYQRERPVLYWDHVNTPQFSLVWPYRDPRRWSFREARP